VFVTPTILNRLAIRQAARSTSIGGLATLLCAGAPLYAEDYRRARDSFGLTIAQAYGQMESPLTITALPKHVYADVTHPRYAERMASVGYPQAVVQVRIAAPDDAPCAAGETGEVLVRGETVMRGYWRNPEATAETLRDGWLHTGDLGSMSADGFVTLKDRSKDLIISGGSNIYPREIEDVLMMHSDILEAAVVGRPHPDWGEEAVAFVVLKDGAVADPARLDRFCADHIARFKRPKAYRFTSTLPQSDYGKVLKSELRKMLAADAEGVVS